MIKRIAIERQYFPLVLKYTHAGSYALITVFVLLNVMAPWAFHQFHLAGATYLPMHIFALIAGLAFGWRAGLLVGLISPLASYAVSGMPVLPILPQVMVEISTYGLVAGILRERFNLRVTWSLLGAMIGGRLALLLAVAVIYLISGQVNSPLGSEAGPFFSVWSAVRLGSPGILLQVLLIPAIFWAAEKFARKKQAGTGGI